MTTHKNPAAVAERDGRRTMSARENEIERYRANAPADDLGGAQASAQASECACAEQREESERRARVVAAADVLTWAGALILFGALGLALGAALAFAEHALW